jgi:hypothetical protein
MEFPGHSGRTQIIGGARRRLLDHPEGAGGDPGLALIRCFAGAGVPSGLVNLV